MLDNTQSEPVAWTAVQVLGLAAAGGAFGGLVELLAALQVKKKEWRLRSEPLGWAHFVLLAAIQILIGICGAFAVLFVFSSTTWFPSTDTPHNELWIVTLGVVAGFGARRFLPIVTKRLESKINDLEEKIEKEREDTALNFERDRVRETVSQALAVLTPDANPTRTELDTHIMRLREILKTHPRERHVVIVAGRLNRRLGELREGIALHSAFLTKKEAQNELDIDFADVLYNRACYRCQLWKDDRDAKLLTDGLHDIRRAIEYNPYNRTAVIEDGDFEPWRGLAEFDAAVGRHEGGRPSSTPA